MAIKLYEENVYLKEANCKILEVITEGDKKFLVTDRTIFFPEGGGQPSDIGYIGDMKVLDVIERDGETLHQVEKVIGNKDHTMYIDWSRRLDNMQQHCGEHILSGLFMKKYSAVNKGFHLGEEVVTIDIDIKDMTKEMMDEIEDLANEAIYENKPVKIHQGLTKEEAEKFNVRKETKVDEDIRMVEIEGVDIVACCGSHPERTGEVGIIKVLKFEKYKGMTRIFFICGNRALKNYRFKHDLIQNIGRKYSADETSLMERLIVEEQKMNKLRSELNKVSKLVNDSIARDLIAKANNGIIIELLDDISSDNLMAVGKRITEETENLACIASANELKVIMMHSGGSKVHCGKFFKDNLSAFSGKGGGGDKMAQGMFTRLDDLNCFLDAAKMMIK